VVFERFLEVAHNAVAFRGWGVDRHQIVIVKIHAPGAERAQALHRDNRIERRPNELAEGIASAVADGPETKSKLVRRLRSQGFILHMRTDSIRCTGSLATTARLRYQQPPALWRIHHACFP
jgi:hypothetical protein